MQKHIKQTTKENKKKFLCLPGREEELEEEVAATVRTRAQKLEGIRKAEEQRDEEMNRVWCDSKISSFDEKGQKGGNCLMIAEYEGGCTAVEVQLEAAMCHWNTERFVCWV